MSIQNFVFLKKKHLPMVQSLTAALSSHALPLQLPTNFDLNSESLLRVDALFERLPCVFDYALANYKESDWSWSDEDARRFIDCEVVAMFNCYSNAQEIMALMITSCILANHTQGLLYAPVFHDELIETQEAMAFLKKHFDDIKSQFNGVSQLR